MIIHTYKALATCNDVWVHGFLDVLTGASCNMNEVFIKRYDEETDTIKYIKVIKTTVCEYTGYDTYNGTNIFESDVVLYKGAMYVVLRECSVRKDKWDSPKWVLMSLDNESECLTFKDVSENGQEDRIMLEVLGNTIDVL